MSAPKTMTSLQGCRAPFTNSFLICLFLTHYIQVFVGKFGFEGFFVCCCQSVNSSWIPNHCTAGNLASLARTGTTVLIICYDTYFILAVFFATLQLLEGPLWTCYFFYSEINHWSFCYSSVTYPSG